MRKKFIFILLSSLLISNLLISCSNENATQDNSNTNNPSTTEEIKDTSTNNNYLKQSLSEVNSVAISDENKQLIMPKYAEFLEFYSKVEEIAKTQDIMVTQKGELKDLDKIIGNSFIGLSPDALHSFMYLVNFNKENIKENSSELFSLTFPYSKGNEINNDFKEMLKLFHKDLDITKLQKKIKDMSSEKDEKVQYDENGFDITLAPQKTGVLISIKHPIKFQ